MHDRQSATNQRSSVARGHWIWVFVLVLLAGYVLAIGTGWLTVAAEQPQAPAWVLMVIAGILLLAVLLLLRQYPVLVELLATLLLAGFVAIGIWVALWGDSAQFSAGLPWLPEHINVLLDRGVFLFGAACSLALMVWALVRMVRLLQH